ncbi:protein of unknown function (plasmid) [Cupriavidus taiwanensis]|uniref:Uncharacterized protein n=1 Tax=Cupriavidus taiwanensis TaxID=164546 RepID=A0A375ISP5_9BURK|nr:protein of unknown function [Cupriavidus taiwanensis]
MVPRLPSIPHSNGSLDKVRGATGNRNPQHAAGNNKPHFDCIIVRSARMVAFGNRVYPMMVKSPRCHKKKCRLGPAKKEMAGMESWAEVQDGRGNRPLGPMEFASYRV